MLAARAELSAGRIFEHCPSHGENVERDLGPGEIWHHDNIVDWTAQLLIAHSGEILLGTNAAAFGILKVSHRRDIHQAPKAETVDAVSRLHTGRSEEHTSELQSLMRISYAVFCLKKNKT